MIIPVRCVTCNKMIADKWNKYLELINKDGKGKPKSMISIHVTDYKTDSPELVAFKKLGIKRYCCRRHLLSHIDLINEI